jgi:diguanylate cyclase (GGDEF)-like protein
MLVDLDGFKLINDTLGHEVGDLLLKEVADRLRGEVDASDLVARLGGDEFVVLLDEPADAARATDVAHRILATTARPFALAGQELHLTASIGISMHPRDGDDARTLLKSSDLAMYRAKEHGRNRLQFFSEEMNIRSRRRLNARVGAAPGARAGRASTALPAAPRSAVGPPHRGRGAAALAAPRRSGRGTRRVHPRGRGDRDDPRHRRLGAARGRSAMRRVARRGSSRSR